MCLILCSDSFFDWAVLIENNIGMQLCILAAGMKS